MAPGEPAAGSGPAGAALILRVEVAMSPAPREMLLVALRLPIGATVLDALRASPVAVTSGLGAEGFEALHVGIWGRKATLETVLREGDRVECYRALKVDPKEARRVRYRAYGEKLPKGIHRSRGRAVDMTHAPGTPADEPAD